MKDLSAVNQEDKKKLSFLCRVGEYRAAAALALKSRKVCKPPYTSHDLALPFSLHKSGRNRASLMVTLQMLSRLKEPSPEILDLLCSALRSTRIEPEELLFAISITQHLHLRTVDIAAIAASFVSHQLRSLYLEEAARRYNYSQDELNFIKSWISHAEGDDTNALRLLQGLTGKETLTRDSAMLAAVILHNNGDLYHARRYACFALRIDCKDIAALDLLGKVLYQESKWKATRRIYALLHSFADDDISLLNMHFTLPQLALSTNDLTDSLTSFRENLALIHAEIKGLEISLKICSPLCHSFYLAYQGSIPLRELLELYNKKIRMISEKIVTDNSLTHAPIKHSKDSRIFVEIERKVRIGFISRNLCQHSNLQAHEGLIRNLDHSLFHVCLIHRSGAKRDSAHNLLNSSVNQVVYLESDFGGDCKKIAELNLDILFFTDIGMYPLDSVLAIVRLAPYQITSWGIPHTSGLRELDYYLRSNIFDDCEDRTEYTETLMPIKGYLGYFSIDKTALTPKPREYFFLPPDRFLIGCLQSLHKLHPDFDEYLDLVAGIDESILIVIAASESDALNRRFARRIKHSAPRAYRQMCFLQKMNMGDYYSLNNLLDLNLDPIHYGAGVTFIHTAWCGPPCVTQRGVTVRSSVVSRSYQYAGILNPPVASDKAEYVGIVESLMRDSARRLKLKHEIHAKSEGTIYDNRQYVKSCQEFFTNLALRGILA